jgi:hypothetical protein
MKASRQPPADICLESPREKSVLTASYGRGSLSATHAITRLANRDHRERWMHEFFT